MSVLRLGDGIAPAQHLQRAHGVQGGGQTGQALPLSTQGGRETVAQPLSLIAKPGPAVHNLRHGIPEDPALSHALQPGAGELQLALHGAVHAPLQLKEGGVHVVLIGDGQLRPVGGRGCPHIGHKVGDGHVGLMPHGRDHRDLRGENAPGHVLVVEGPQVLHGPAAPSGDDEVGHPVAVGPGQGSAELAWGLAPLHPHRDDHHLGHGPAGVQDAQHIPHRRPGRRGDEGDFPGKFGQRLFPGRVKESLPVELFLALLKGQMEVADAVGRQLAAIELVLPVPGEYRDAAVGDDLHAVLGAEAQVDRLPPEEDAPDGSLRVLHGKIVVSRGVELIVGDLPPNKNAGQKLVAVQHALDILVDLGHGIDRRPAHGVSPPFRSRWARMATPMALSVE